MGQEIMPLPYSADPGERLSGDGDCWVINCEQGSVAEMQCPADVEKATAKFIARAANAHDALVDAARKAVALMGYLHWNDDPAGRRDKAEVYRELTDALALAEKES